MSVINSMLRDLDRRHAPLPAQGSVQPTFEPGRRALPRLALCAALALALALWSWHRHAANTAITAAPAALAPTAAPAERAQPEQRPETGITPAQEIAEPAARHAAERPVAMEISSNDDRQPTGSQASATEQRETSSAEQAEQPAAPRTAAPIIRQQRSSDDAIIAERYRLARAALAQNQPQRAYELLRDEPPPMAPHSDYHAVLAAVEQQLGHYRDASLRYQQLLLLDQNQASWWLGLALSLDGQQRGADARAAYERALAFNALPDAAQHYARTRSAALAPQAGAEPEKQ